MEGPENKTLTEVNQNVLLTKVINEHSSANTSVVSSDPEITLVDTSDEVALNEQIKKKPVTCQICCSCEAKYTCPRCEARTCSVPCVKEHKLRTSCTGERNKSAFVDLSDYNDRHLLNDYRFLEEAERRLFNNTPAPSSYRAQKAARYVPYHISKRCKFLMNAAYKRGISLKFVSPGLTKSKSNSSFFTISTDEIEWHVDWLFSSSNTLIQDKKVSEKTVVVEAVRKFTNFTEHPHYRKSLEDYRGAKLDSCQFLLKMENLPANRSRYFALKPTLALGESLKGMCLTEYPTIVVVPESDSQAQEKYCLLLREDMPLMEVSCARHIIQHHPELNPAPSLEQDLLNPNSELYKGPVTEKQQLS